MAALDAYTHRYIHCTQFDWDDGNRAKVQKHGLSVAEIEGFFRRAPRVAPDPRHSQAEARFIAVGRTAQGRPAFVAFCWRGACIRPISARYMHAREARRYEESSPDDH
ncbi:MAG: hypothetical protein RIR62_1046 [Pseudomonadota bacterium]|jgi:uncharacterized DUF497 family protein